MMSFQSEFSFLSGSIIETTLPPLLLDAGKASGRRRREIRYIFLMVSLTPSQSSRLVSCFAFTQSVSLDLVSSKLEKTFVVFAQVFKATGTASFTGVSRRSCTRSTFHLFPSFEFGHMRSRSERTSVGCSGFELRSDKAQNSAFKSTSSHHRHHLQVINGVPFLFSRLLNPNIPIITAFSPPSYATALHPDDGCSLALPHAPFSTSSDLMFSVPAPPPIPDPGFLQPGWLLVGRISIVCGLGPVPLRKKATLCLVNQYPLRITRRVN
ncbi:hypothetical protein Bca4012_061693 [Brassica carinata]